MLKRLLAAVVRDLLRAPPAPERLRIRNLGEFKMQKYEADLPTPGATDVVERKFHVEVDGVDAVQTLAKDAVKATFGVEDGKTFKVWLTDVDDAGNESPFDPASTYTATATDELAPPSPGAPTVRHVGEE